MRLFVVALVGMLLLEAHGQQQLLIHSEIIPLHSTRNDVEKYARFEKSFRDYDRYETESETLDVYYSTGPCVSHGWNIGRDVVISFLSYPKQKLPVEELLINKEKYIVTTNDIGTQFFTNRSEGVQYSVPAGRSSADHIRFVPTDSSADSKLRCPGFPPYDPVTENYVPYQISQVRTAHSWDAGILTPTFNQIQTNLNYNGYIFVYCRRGVEQECRQVKSKIDRALSAVLRNQGSRFSVGLGGYRKRTEIETFLIHKENPPATARPIYPR